MQPENELGFRAEGLGFRVGSEGFRACTAAM